MIRKESAKCMRFCIGACKDHPDKQRTLFIMTYVCMMEELEKRRQKEEWEQVNTILKELYKMTNQFAHFKQQNMTLFSV